MKSYIDSHSHLADPRLDSQREILIQQAADAGIRFHLQGGVGPEDWDRQWSLHKSHPEIWPVFGLHPYWVADHTDDECETALDLLAKKIGRAFALGETGLDFRPHIAKESEDRQISYFEKQLELASFSRKPVILHLVQAHSEAIKIIGLWGLPQAGGMVHSFNGNVPQAEELLLLGLYLSVGGPAARAGNQKLHQAIAVIPDDKLLIETDSPDQPPDSLKGQLNQPTSLIDVAQSVAKIRKRSAEEILEISSQNLRKLLNRKS